MSNHYLASLSTNLGMLLGLVAPVLVPAVQLYTLINDILSPEAQNKLYGYFQDAAKDRCRRHMTEINMYISGKGQSSQMDHFSVVKAYQTMISVCHNIRNEISTDVEIPNSNILPSFIDLPNISSAIYSAELASLLRAFLVAFPPTAPSRHVNDLITATANFQKDLVSWNINPVQTGVDTKELFYSNIMMWIQNTSLSLLETCKLLHKVKRTQDATIRRADLTNQFVNEMYGRLTETLNDYEFIIRRWPEYTFDLENVVVDIKNAVIEALDKQYASIIAPLKENKTPMNKCIGLKCVQKLAKRTKTPYLVSPELGTLLNSMKRMLDVFHPKIERKLKSWGSCCILDV